jgi:hypothetical protein
MQRMVDVVLQEGALEDYPLHRELKSCNPNRSIAIR